MSATGGTGYAFLIYRSYINTYLNFSEFTYGYSKNNFIKESPQIYQISSMEYVSIGNAGKGINFEIPQIFETEHWGIDGDNSGVYYNRELAYEMSTYKENFDSQNPLAYEKIYKENSSLTLPVTQEQLDRVIETCNRLNYYHIVENNCVVVASTAWNAAFSNDIDFHLPVVIIPSTLREAIDEYEQSYEFDIYRKVFGIYI